MRAADAMQALTGWIVPLLLLAVPLYGAAKRVPVFAAFVRGAEDGMRLTFRLAPYLLGLLFAIGLFRDTGAMAAATAWLVPVLGPAGLPPEVAPLVLIRPISGSGALALATSLLQDHGPDSAIGRLASTLLGSTETTFYVLSVYFAAAKVRRSRWAVVSGLAGDVVSFVAAAAACAWFFGS